MKECKNTHCTVEDLSSRNGRDVLVGCMYVVCTYSFAATSKLNLFSARTFMHAFWQGVESDGDLCIQFRKRAKK